MRWHPTAACYTPAFDAAVQYLEGLQDLAGLSSLERVYGDLLLDHLASITTTRGMARLNSIGEHWVRCGAV